METVEIPNDVWSPIKSLVRHGIYKNEKSALINIVHDMSLSKMTEFKSAMKELEKKYHTDFEDFQSKIKAAEKENFEKWDDYIEWKAYFTAYNYWKSIHEESSQWL
ncbi:MAG: hypothetical protein O8C64_12390 [Candidatus Methanoperedens sp.]|nr:hypothetical protein [Candidatus Methanoperedens sp.]MCZ7384389.1 hypothetical protein [Candidatus Methanoperedens sp.]MCZ7403717.1 hypothetical protein [Candidatus Methanoperedens sp.]